MSQKQNIKCLEIFQKFFLQVYAELGFKWTPFKKNQKEYDRMKISAMTLFNRVLIWKPSLLLKLN